MSTSTTAEILSVKELNKILREKRHYNPNVVDQYIVDTYIQGIRYNSNYRYKETIPKNYKHPDSPKPTTNIPLYQLSHGAQVYFYDSSTMTEFTAHLQETLKTFDFDDIINSIMFYKNRIGDLNSAYGKVYLSGISNDYNYQKFLSKMNKFLDNPHNMYKKITKLTEQSDSCFALKQLAIRPDPDQNKNAHKHEYLIGEQLTRLRLKDNTCPYFMCSFWSYVCKSPQVIGNKLINNCATAKNSFFIVQENISNSISLADAIENDEYKPWIGTYLYIIAYALQRAFVEFGFIHGDLHDGNILIRNKNNLYYLPVINSEGFLTYVTCKGCPTLIDNGYSSTDAIKWYSLDGFSPISTPMHDFIRLTGNLNNEWKKNELDNSIFIHMFKQLVSNLLPGSSIVVDDKIIDTYSRFGGFYYTKYTMYTVLQYLENNQNALNIRFYKYPIVINSRLLNITHKRDYNLYELIEYPELKELYLEQSLETENKIMELLRKCDTKLDKLRSEEIHKGVLLLDSLHAYIKKEIASREHFISLVNA